MKRVWWKEAVVYQIYPRSFMDSNGDGIGDLNGITQRLDYLKDLGADVIWLSPIFKSPNADNGYDVSDYYGIMSEFGTMADFDRLMQEVHSRDMKLLLDFVANHTSDEHEWFRESRSSKNSPMRDYFYWRPGKNGREPNNWGANFSPSAWAKDDLTGEYYLHYYHDKQPDLNWHHPEVREGMYRAMRFWLDKGVDGYRMDALNMLAKLPGLADAPQKNVAANGYAYDWPFYANNPGIHEFIREMNREVWQHYDVLIVGECAFITPEMGLEYTAESHRELDLVFQFQMMDAATLLPRLKTCIDDWYQALRHESWNAVTFNNHDTPRQVSKFGNDDKYRIESAKLFATLLLTIPGTPFIYQGEELGMTNVYFESIDDYRDVAMFDNFNKRVSMGENPVAVLNQLRPNSRDNARTPMPWNSGKNGGFTSGEPWIKMNPNFSEINAEENQKDGQSVFHFYKSLIAYRKAHPALVYGAYQEIKRGNPTVYAFLRQADTGCFLIVLNYSDNPQVWEMSDRYIECDPKLVMANYQNEVATETKFLTLLPWEARIYELSN